MSRKEVFMFMSQVLLMVKGVQWNKWRLIISPVLCDVVLSTWMHVWKLLKLLLVSLCLLSVCELRASPWFPRRHTPAGLH